MFYSDFIEVDDNFQYSVNLQYDINKLYKIDRYIPTSNSVEILNKYIKSIYTGVGDRATVLIGPYGKGKSHLLLVLLSILSLENDICDENQKYLGSNVISNLISKFEKFNPGLTIMTNEIRKQNNRFVPIIINAGYSDVRQAFLIALKEALERIGLVNLLPDTSFTVILDTLKMWKDSYPDAHKKLNECLKEEGVKYQQFVKKIASFDTVSFKLFKKIYPMITSGAQFNPLINSDIVKLYENINYKLCELYNFQGIIVVFDEFSKFLESNSAKEESDDMTIIQQFAELSNNSKEEQIHFICVTHKSINEYESKLPKAKINGWRAVEGRFKEIYFTTSSEQNYELISDSIKKNEDGFVKFISKNQNAYNDIIVEYKKLTIFQHFDKNYFEDTIVKGCFPLLPITSFLLPRVSEKVAQNERTLFTFLSKDENGSLKKFISSNKGSMNLLTVDYIYDYFEILFKKETFNENVHLLWGKADYALTKTNDPNARKIIKAVAIIYIVNELDKLPPIDSIILQSTFLKQDEYENAINNLVENQILIKKQSNGFYNFLSGLNVNINKMLDEYINLNISNVKPSELMEKICDLGYVLPKKFNDDYAMVRFFKNIFIDIEQLNAISDITELLGLYRCDGLVLKLIYYNVEDRAKAEQKITQINDKRVLFCIPNSPFDKMQNLKQFIAIDLLRKDQNFIEKDEYLLQELIMYEEDVKQLLNDYVIKNYTVSYGNCKCISCDGSLSEIQRHSQLNRKLSEICEQVYNNTPIINNELINKNNISAPILKARNIIIETTLKGFNEEILKSFEGRSPEATIFRATLLNKGLLNSTTSNDENLNKVLNEIKRFVNEAESEKRSFSHLYNILCGSMYGYGVRKGIIPIYLAYVLKYYKENTIVYYVDKEIPLTFETMNKINEKPELYRLYIEKGTAEKEQYLFNLHELFKSYELHTNYEYNKFNQVVKAMQSWMHFLPKYTREYDIEWKNDKKGKLIQEAISKEVIQLRNELLKYDINSRDFLFEKVMKKILKLNSYEECVIRLREIKLQLDNHLNEVRKVLVLETKKIFNKNYKGEIKSALKNWFEDLNQDNKDVQFNNLVCNRMRDYIKNLTINDEEMIINNFAFIATGLNIEDWNDRTVDKYIETIDTVKKEVENYKKEDSDSKSNNLCLIAFDGSEKPLPIQLDSITGTGETLLSEFEQIFEEYADSITVGEKRSILLNLLKQYM